MSGAAVPRVPSLRAHSRVSHPEAAVLVLHGGRSESLSAPPPWNLPDARMRPFVRSLARASAGSRVLLCRVGYRCRGWNGARADAARDARWALDELTRIHGELPVVLVGHSMGGRAALRVGGHPRVRGVVALAPWCPPGEPAAQLAGRRLVLAHGDRDRVTDPSASREFARRARREGADARFVPVPGGDHAMLRGSGGWHRLVDEEVMALLAPVLASPPDSPATAADRTYRGERRNTDGTGAEAEPPDSRAVPRRAPHARGPRPL